MGLLSLTFFCIVLIWFFYGESIMRSEGKAQQPQGKYIPDVLLVSLGKMLALMSKAWDLVKKERKYNG